MSVGKDNVSAVNTMIVPRIWKIVNRTSIEWCPVPVVRATSRLLKND